MIRFRNQRILWQVLLWWGSWVLISFLLSNGYDNPHRFAMRAAHLFIGFFIVVAVNIKYLLPHFYLTKRHVLFVILGLALLGVTALLLYAEFLPLAEWFDPRPRKPRISGPRGRRATGILWIGRLTPLIIAFLGSTVTEIARYANRKEKEAIQSEKEKLETELKFLKSQVNPHFLFNALNNIYSLAVLRDPQTPESVMQLSEILRYMVYDSNEEKVPLKNEIQYIQNYVDLKRLKDSRGMDLEIDMDSSAENLMVAPLLFIPFVENAFKHSKIENLKKGFIKINMQVRDNLIDFSVVNSLPEEEFTKDEVGGIGLDNVLKRLDLLYPGDKHTLNIQRTHDQYKVHLKVLTG